MKGLTLVSLLLAVRSFESAFSSSNHLRGFRSAFGQWGWWEALSNLNEECIFRRHFRVSSDCLSSCRGKRMLLLPLPRICEAEEPRQGVGARVWALKIKLRFSEKDRKRRYSWGDTGKKNPPWNWTCLVRFFGPTVRKDRWGWKRKKRKSFGGAGGGDVSVSFYSWLLLAC